VRFARENKRPRVLPAAVLAAGLAVVLIAVLATVLAAGTGALSVAFGEGANEILGRDAVLRDPEIPALGNPQGDLTVVEYFDYQCPYCKKLAPEIAQVVREDGKIKLVLKDWPIFGAVSKSAAQLTLAAKYQNKYQEAHDALIGATEKLSDTAIPELLTKAGVDVEKARQDLEAHQKTIDDLLFRNDDQAAAFGFEGTPSFIVGFFRVPGAVEMNVFKQIIADARVAAKKHKT
jgi:protein-disulfide isomerase